MLKNIPPLLSPELLLTLAEMGHGDELVIADRNFPAESVAARTVTGRCIHLTNTDTVEAGRQILKLMPLDSFVDMPIRRMAPVGEPQHDLEVHTAFLAMAREEEGRDVGMEAIERFGFYEAAANAYAIVRTTEDRPYANFILKKGVIFK